MVPAYHPRIDLRQRIALLKWMLPIGILVGVTAYQLILARWVQAHLSDTLHFAVEIVFYTTVGSLLTFRLASQTSRWLKEKEQAEQQAQAHERRLASITLASADAILGVDPLGCIESWNRGAEALFQYPAAEVTGHPLSDVLVGSEVEFQWLAHTTREAGFVRGYETTCRRADGTALAIDLTATDIVDDEGNSLGMAIILRDITERKRREEESRDLNAQLNAKVEQRTRELAEKVEQLARANTELRRLDQTRSDFVSLMSHQVRAPLTNMKGAMERMQVDCAVVNPTCSRMFAILDQQAQRLDRLVRDVLRATRLETSQLLMQQEPMSVMPVLHQVVDQIRARTGDRPIHLPIKPGLPMVYADRDQVTEVLVNLIDNADKYSPPGKAIEILVRADQVEVTLSVKDHGPGIAEDALCCIFDKFYRVDSSDSQVAYGYGLGLFICRRLIEAQGGRIWVENHLAGGCIFSFTIPVWHDNHDVENDSAH